MLIDFSCKHDIMIRNDDGTLTPMDEPYFEATKIADGVWQILSSGDYSYLLEGDVQGFVIDSGYGAGNLREYCEQLLGKPVPDIANTHDHFDHTANNAYFDRVFLTAATKELATIPFPSFSGIVFPRDYNTVIVKAGDVIPLAGRPLRIFELPDHAVGSIALLDEKSRILFTGDEITPEGAGLHGGVRTRLNNLLKIMEYRDKFDKLYAGCGFVDAIALEKQIDAIKLILDGYEGEMDGGPRRHNDEYEYDAEGHIVYGRRLPHTFDNNHDHGGVDDSKYKRVVRHNGYRIGYDIRNKDL